MIKKGDTVIYNGETVKVIATPEILHSSDPKYYLIEDYSRGWYPSLGQPHGAYGVQNHKKYYWVIDPKHLTPVNDGSSLTVADIKPGRYRVLSTKNVRNYEHNHHGKVVGEIVKITEKDITYLAQNSTFTIENNRWGTNFVPSDFEWVGEELLVQAPPRSKFGVGERVIYNGSEAVVARVDGGSMYTIQLFNGDGWSGDGHQGLLSTGKYWAVNEVDLKSAPIQTKIPVETPYRVTLPPRMVDPAHYGYGAFGSAGMMTSMVDPYYDKHRSERTLLADMERDYQRQREKRYYEKAADLVEKKSDKPVTNQPPDAYIQQPIIVTKRKTKHSLTTV